MLRREFISMAAIAVPIGTWAYAAELESNPIVRLVTSLGPIDIELELRRAPRTSTNFLRLIDAASYDGGGGFYRSVAPSRDSNPIPISVVQGGLGSAPTPFAPIAHESTRDTGLRHLDGTISMARGKIGSASTEFFICLGDNPELDFGGRRAVDGEGFAAFGAVVEGMDIVRKIHECPLSEEGAGTSVAHQLLASPVDIVSTSRR